MYNSPVSDLWFLERTAKLIIIPNCHPNVPTFNLSTNVQMRLTSQSCSRRLEKVFCEVCLPWRSLCFLVCLRKHRALQDLLSGGARSQKNEWAWGRRAPWNSDEEVNKDSPFSSQHPLPCGSISLSCSFTAWHVAKCASVTCWNLSPIKTGTLFFSSVGVSQIPSKTWHMVDTP